MPHRSRPKFNKTETHSRSLFLAPALKNIILTSPLIPPTSGTLLPQCFGCPSESSMAAVRLPAPPLSLYLFLPIFLLSLSPPLSLSLPDADTLLKFKKSLTNAAALDSWLPDTPPCDWDGVRCSDGVIANLNLAKLNLSGDIDVDALGRLSGLRTISLENNSFSGPMPGLNRLASLKAIFLTGNQFSGEIPGDFFAKMGSLRKVWLGGNRFSGRIPASLGQISRLMELHLEYNQFSGPIPPMAQPSLMWLDLSHNNLEGEIPSNMSRFDERSFRGNSGLCGKPLRNRCKREEQAPSPSPSPASRQSEEQNSSTGNSKIGWAIAGAVAGLVLLAVLVLLAKQRKRERFDVLQKDSTSEAGAVEVHIRSSSSSSSSSGCSKRKEAGGGGGGVVVVNEERGVFGLQDLMKAAAEVLGNGGLGSAYKAVMGSGVCVVVKRMREMNELSKEGFDAEMRRMGRLRHPNILTPLAYHFRKEEKLLVSEYAPKGSLLYTLHGDRGDSHAELTWATRLKIIQGIASGLGFLHSEFASYQLPHGNLKSSNVLLGPHNDPLLCDYAFHPLINETQAVQSMFAYKSPEAISQRQVSPKSDVYCLGIVILEVLTGKFPSQYLNNQKGGTDVVQWMRSAISEKRETELIDPEIACDARSDSMAQTGKLLLVAADCTVANPDHRIPIAEAIRRIEEIQV